MNQALIDALLAGQAPPAPASAAPVATVVPSPVVVAEPVDRAAPAVEIASMVTTGNSELDKKLGGGIPPGSLTLIEGESDSGKSVFVQQLIHGSLRAGTKKIVLYSTEDSTASFVKQMQSLALDILDFFLMGRLDVYTLPNAFATDGVFDILLNHMGQYSGAKIFVIDSLTSFLLHASESETLTFFSRAKELCDHGCTIITTAHSYALPDQLLTRLTSMSDAHFKMRVEDAGIQLVKALHVAKIRGASKSTGNIVTFDVEPNFGIKVIPITKAKA